jgi:hypothetical protein
MQPGTYDLKVYRGDYYYGSVIPLFSLAPWGGPSNPTIGTTLKAEVKKQKNSSSAVTEFDVDVVDETEMTVRLTMEPEDTAKITQGMFWDLQISTGPTRNWTPLAGKVTPSGQVTD